MTIAELRRALIEIPDALVPVPAGQLAGVEAAVSYLDSDAASERLAADSYWPKWSSPWWQMVLLFELGEAHTIPQRAVRAMVTALDALPLHTFPIRPEDWPPGLDRARHSSCHCALGTIDQVLTACGVDVDAELPWIRPWFARYQMRDGGMNCDETAYLVEDECPSSMVGTMAAFEAMLRRGPSEFVDKAAAFLVERKLVLGSRTRHNAEERDAAIRWLAPTFPRFYFYDVLRGATALVRWAATFRRAVPLRAIVPAAIHLVGGTRDGIVRVERHGFAGQPTWTQGASGTWVRVPEASRFPLLDAVSELGAASARLTDEWRTTRRAIIELIDAGLVAA